MTTRRDALKVGGLALLAATTSEAKSMPTMPVLFVGHGSPMNAVLDNTWTRAFRALGPAMPKPKAILAISAHWYGAGTFVTSNDSPPTIHDFGGFPRALFEIEYPARGDGALAKRISALVDSATAKVAPSQDWGLDHGTWSVLVHLRPEADVPVLQLSLDARLTPAQHVAIGRALAPLRDEGVLIMGSGNITHNLRFAMREMQTKGLGFEDFAKLSPQPWATQFDSDVAKALVQRDRAFLVRATESDIGRMSHPTPDHWLPLLYAAGAGGDDDVTFPNEGFDGGSFSMRIVRFG